MDFDQLIKAFRDLCVEQRHLEAEAEAKVKAEVDFKTDVASEKLSQLKKCSQNLAIELYTKAAELERVGEISKAMELYNRAFKLDPDVEKRIDYDALASQINRKEFATTSDPLYNPFKSTKSAASVMDPDDLCGAILMAMNSQKASALSGSFFTLPPSKTVPSVLDLPSDILSRVLGYLGWMHLPSLEVVAGASRALYLATREESVWKFLWEKEECNGRDHQHRNQSQAPHLTHLTWRAGFIFRPRFRTDGLYISKITYFRQGYEEGAAYQPYHLVTYYRYLRFFNNPQRFGGRRLVISLVTTERPSTVINKLREADEVTLRMIREKFFPANSSLKQQAHRSTSNGNRPSAHDSSSASPTAHKSNLFMGGYWRATEPSHVSDGIEPSNEESIEDRCFHLLLFDAHSGNPMKLSMRLRLGDSRKGISSRSARCSLYCGQVERKKDGGGESRQECFQFNIHNWGKFYFSRVKSYQ